MFKQVSVIIPFVSEWPQIAFTIRAVREQLEDARHHEIINSYEIICIDNYCKEAFDQGVKTDRGGDHYVLNKKNLGLYGIDPEIRDKATFQTGHIMAQSQTNKSWLKCYKYEDKLSHWNAKNLGIRKATGDTLIFLDSHVVPSRGLLVEALFSYYQIKERFNEDITMHLPLSYHILEDKRLMYKMIYEPLKGNLHYSFTSMPMEIDRVVEVPCMSTCGMIVDRGLMLTINCWPKGMGIYGGGENYINYLFAILGVKKLLYHNGCLHHHGDRRSYSYNWTDYHCNRMIATYIFGGPEMVGRYQVAIGDNGNTEDMMRRSIKAGWDHIEEMTRKRQEFSIGEFVEKWSDYRAIEYPSGRNYV